MTNLINNRLEFGEDVSIQVNFHPAGSGIREEVRKQYGTFAQLWPGYGAPSFREEFRVPAVTEKGYPCMISWSRWNDRWYLSCMIITQSFFKNGLGQKYVDKTSANLAEGIPNVLARLSVTEKSREILFGTIPSTSI